VHEGPKFIVVDDSVMVRVHARHELKNLFTGRLGANEPQNVRKLTSGDDSVPYLVKEREELSYLILTNFVRFRQHPPEPAAGRESVLKFLQGERVRVALIGVGKNIIQFLLAQELT